MRTLSMAVLVVVAVLLALLSSAQASPKIGCAQPEFNFGTKESGTSTEGSFIISNDGDQPLKISDAKPDCGCMSAKVTEKTIPPGGHATLTAELSLASQKGALRKGITIESNDPQHPRLQVYMVGTAAEPLTVSPSQGIFFGSVNPHAGEERTIHLLAHTPDQAFHITEVVVGEKQPITARYEEIEKEKAYRVHLKLSDQLPPGEFRGSVQVRTSNPRFSVITVRVTATVVSGELAISPPELRVLYPRDVDGITSYIAIAPAQVKAFRITEVRSPSASVSATATRMPDGAYRIKVTGLVPSAELQGKCLIVKTDLHQLSTIQIPIRVIQMGRTPIPSAPAEAAGGQRH